MWNWFQRPRQVQPVAPQVSGLSRQDTWQEVNVVRGVQQNPYRNNVGIYDNGELIAVKDYRIIKKLGKGGFGTTYLAEKNGREYVVKEMESKLASDEYNALTHLGYNCVKHINCPEALIHGDGTSYLITQYIPGHDLDYYENADLSQGFIRSMMVQLLEAIMYIHSVGIAHRDIKTGNIMYVDVRDQFFLIDFGIACFHESRSLVCPLDCAGTPLFMFPDYESQCSSKRTDPAYFELLKVNDLFALGVTFFLVIENQYPWAYNDSGIYNFDLVTKYRKATPAQQEIIDALLTVRVGQSTEVHHLYQKALALPK